MKFQWYGVLQSSHTKIKSVLNLTCLTVEVNTFQWHNEPVKSSHFMGCKAATELYVSGISHFYYKAFSFIICDQESKYSWCIYS